jgi:hypothetical protein
VKRAAAFRQSCQKRPYAHHDFGSFLPLSKATLLQRLIEELTLKLSAYIKPLEDRQKVK